MAILIDEKKRVLVQGITGREGQARTRLMRDYGTNVVAGVTPGKGGQSVLGVPVFNTPHEAVQALGQIDISVLFVPASGVKDAAISAIDAGIKLTVLVPDRVPVWDAMEIAAAANTGANLRDRGAYLDALHAKVDIFVTSDKDLAEDDAAKRLSTKYGLRVLTPPEGGDGPNYQIT